MSLLSAVQAAAGPIALARPEQVFAATDQDMLDMQVLVNEVSKQITDANQAWSSLQKFYTINGDGVSTTYPLPDDYDHMAQTSQIWCSDLPQAPLEQVGSLDDWMAIETMAIEPFFRRWLLQGQNITFRPILPSASTAQFSYYSRNVVRAADNSVKEYFDADTDTFILPERLLTLGIIWNWKSRKGVDYSEEFSNFSEALAREVTRDQGPGTIIRSRYRSGWYSLPPYGYPR